MSAGEEMAEEEAHGAVAEEEAHGAAALLPPTSLTAQAQIQGPTWD